MERTIVLGPFASRWIYFMIGISHTILGISKLTESPLTKGDLITGLLYLIIGVTLFFLAFVLFSPFFWFTPKLTVDTNKILFRENIFKRTKNIEWKDIQGIEYKSFELEFQYNNGVTESLYLKTDSERSIEVKRALREIADKKSIPIDGG
jgi:hypothetical protein